MPRAACLLLVLLLGTVQGLARSGYVRTRLGSILEGHIRLESNEVIVVNLDRDFVARIAWTNVAAVGLEAAPATPMGIGSVKEGPWPKPWQSTDVGAAAEP